MASVDLDGDGDALSINVMPLLDIFSILILFLLISFSNDPVQYEISEDVEVPLSITMRSLDQVPQVSVGKTVLKVGDFNVVSLVNGELPDEVIQQGAVFPLYEELKKISELKKRQAEARGDTPEDPNAPNPDAVTIEVDKEVKYKLLRRVMLSAQQADFIAFKLIASKPIE